MTVGEVTPAELVAVGLLSEDYLASAMRLQAFSRYLDHQLAGIPVRWREEEVTTFMGATTGALQRGMLRALTAAAGMSLTSDLRLITGRELYMASNGRKLGRRNIDLAIARWEGDVWTPLACIEAKFNAEINGTWKCTNPAHEGKYTNQIICYPMGCGHEDLQHRENDADASPPFIWLWDLGGESLVNVKGEVRPEDEHIPKYNRAWAEAWALQEQYRKVWKVATWTKLRASVQAELEDRHEQRIIDAAVRALTPRTMPRNWALA